MATARLNKKAKAVVEAPQVDQSLPVEQPAPETVEQPEPQGEQRGKRIDLGNGLTRFDF